MSKAERSKRYLFFLAGLSPISSIPYVLSLGFVPTIGQFTIVFSLL